MSKNPNILNKQSLSKREKKRRRNFSFRFNKTKKKKSLSINYRLTWRDRQIGCDLDICLIPKKKTITNSNCVMFLVLGFISFIRKH